MIINKTRAPNKSLYYIGGRIIEKISHEGNMDIEEMFMRFSNNEEFYISSYQLYLGLDWLYLIGVIMINGNKIELCR